MPLPAILAGKLLLRLGKTAGSTLERSKVSAKDLKIDTSWIGDKAIARDLTNLEPKLKKRVLKKALREEAKETSKAAKALVPVDQGNLKKSIKVKALKRSRKRIGAQVVAGVNLNNAQAIAVEYGTSKRKAQPYLRPAYESREDRAVKNITDKVQEGITKLMTAR